MKKYLNIKLKWRDVKLKKDFKLNRRIKLKHWDVFSQNYKIFS